ncbi:SRPBCC family protein [Rubrobacter indicoceani]|uniref:SRPBCC family protein n=1 Tax=Rubrobacter indicoceani TaxID=2051957 RepID=UPI000E5BFF8F|nr:SRPBCC family protein [Rubrobacter indicoceani]
MKINNEFTVSVPIEEAWNAMLDLERIAPCLPGAAITEQDSEDEYQGTMTVKIGPITAKYKGNVKYEEKDESSHRAVLNATGRDARGQGTASAVITSQMEEVSDGTKVMVETDMKLTGKAAQFGRGIAQDVAGKMLGQFAQCLEQRLGSDGSANGSDSEEGATEAAAGPHATADSSDNGTASTPPASATTAAAASSMSQPVTGASSTTGSMSQPVTSSESAGSGSSSGSSSEEKPRARKIQQDSEPEPLDLGEMSQDAILKRAKPVLIGVGALLMVLLILRGIRGGKKN